MKSLLVKTSLLSHKSLNQKNYTGIISSELEWTKKTKQTPAFRAMRNGWEWKRDYNHWTLKMYQAVFWSLCTFSLYSSQYVCEIIFSCYQRRYGAQGVLTWQETVNLIKSDFHAFIPFPTPLSPSISIHAWSRWGFFWNLNLVLDNLRKKNW